MSKSNRSNRYTVFTLNTFALTAIFGVGTLFAAAQSTPAAQPSSQAQPTLNLSVPTTGTSLFSSSNDEQEGTPVVEASLHPTVENFANAMQYGGGQRRRYGKTRYRGANTNADGSAKYIFYGGAGLSQPVGNTFHYLTPSYGIQVGGGRQFNKHFAVPIEFDYDHFGFAGQTLANQSLIYFGDPAPSDNGFDGSSHVWSFSVDPTYTLLDGADHGGLGAYIVAGVGFYHKVANFTVPQEEEYCDPYYGICEPIEVQGTFDHYTSNAPGFSGGLGLTYKISRFANERFYLEARYVFVDNSQRSGYTPADYAAGNDTYGGTNYYPANSNRTTYIPIKAGIRF
jgi:hypothetical protein